MVGTRIIAGRAVGKRTGLREELSSITRTTRYDLYRGTDYVRSENRVSGVLTTDTVPTEICIVEAGDVRHEFDVRSWGPEPGEAVHVILHRIGFRTIADLYLDRNGTMQAHGDEDPGEPSRIPSAILGILVAGAMHLLGRPVSSAIGWGIGIGVAFHLLSLVRRTYVVHGTAFLRQRAERRLKAARALARNGS